MLSRIIYGARVSVTVGFATIVLGGRCWPPRSAISSGYFRGAYDIVVQRIVDAWRRSRI